MPADQPPPARLRILVADDSLMVREVVCGLLEQQGHETTAVSGGDEAVAALDEGGFDLVLMDVELPGMDGPAAAAAIRKTHERIPILAMTGHRSEEQRARCLAAGMDGFLTKPLDGEKLGDAIERFLGRICRETALRSLQGNRNLLERIVAAYQEEAPRLREEIRAAIDSGDAVTLRRAAHSLHGAMRYFGAMRAVEFAEKLEAMGGSEDLQGAPAALAELETECTRLESALADEA